DLQRQRLAADVDGLGTAGRDQAHAGVQLARLQLPARFVEQQDRGGGNSYMLTDEVGTSALHLRRYRGRRQRCANALRAVAIAEAFDFQIGGRRHVRQSSIGPGEIGVVEVDLQGSEGQRETSAARYDLLLLGRAESLADCRSIEVASPAIAAIE